MSEDQNTNKPSPPPFLLTRIGRPIWLSVSEAAKIGGVTQKTVRRALQSKSLKFKIIQNRYLIDFSSYISYILKNKKLNNKLQNIGIGQYIDKWVK